MSPGEDSTSSDDAAIHSAAVVRLERARLDPALSEPEDFEDDDAPVEPAASVRTRVAALTGVVKARAALRRSGARRDGEAAKAEEGAEASEEAGAEASEEEASEEAGAEASGEEASGEAGADPNA
jgi:hypothetical protein